MKHTIYGNQAVNKTDSEAIEQQVCDKMGHVIASLRVEVDDKGKPTAHLVVNPGCNVGQILIDGIHYRPVQFA